MRSGLFLPPFDELADPVIVARLAAEAEAGWHGVFVAPLPSLGRCSKKCLARNAWPSALSATTGAATLLGVGEVRPRGWTDELDGERVLLVAVADVTMLALQQAGRHARDLGAVEVHGCRVAMAEGIPVPEGVGA
jgi:hypothetical protein